MLALCPPAMIYVAFSLTQVIIDTFKGLYNLAFFKIIVMIVITLLLNTLCQAGMGIVSWILVFIPFLFMSVIVAILLYVFGYNPETGEIALQCTNTTNYGGNMIYSDNNTGASTSDTSSAPTEESSDPEY